MIPSDRRCPRCGNPLHTDPLSDRTTPAGTWWVRRCAVCGHTEDAFVPRRREGQSRPESGNMDVGP